MTIIDLDNKFIVLDNVAYFDVLKEGGMVGIVLVGSNNDVYDIKLIGDQAFRFIDEIHDLIQDKKMESK